MNARRWWWPVCKLLLAIVIVAAVGRQFWLDLRQLDWQALEIRYHWLVLSVLLYLIGWGFSGFFWLRLLHRFGQRPATFTAFRAYYVGHLGKYVPGKALAFLSSARWESRSHLSNQ